MKRLYDTIVQNHLLTEQEMLFLSGPRQVGKTTVSKNAAGLTDRFIYLKWDNEDHRKMLLSQLV
jgi:predicted AAA+ superfamily ATPase